MTRNTLLILPVRSRTIGLQRAAIKKKRRKKQLHLRVHAQPTDRLQLLKGYPIKAALNAIRKEKLDATCGVLSSCVSN